MKRSILIGLVVGMLFVSCEKTASIQSYFVSKMDDSSFFIVNLPIQLNSFFSKKLSFEEQNAVKNIDKLNLLIFLLNEGQEEKYDKELEEISAILSQKQFQILMNFKAFDNSKGSLLINGEGDLFEEVIVFFNSTKIGFGVLRIVGSDIDPGIIVALANKADPDLIKKQFGSFKEELKGLFD